MIPLQIRFNERVRSLRQEVVGILFLVLAASLLGMLWGPGSTFVITFPLIVASGAILLWRYLDANFTHIRIRSTFARAGQWPVFTRLYPLYKWVDIYRGA